MIERLPLYYRYWGKADRDGGRFHLLPYHCLDVTAIAAEWWNFSPTIRASFLSHNCISEEKMRAWVLFFVALHDYGKFDIRFQLRVETVWRLLNQTSGDYKNLPSILDRKSYYHGSGGLFWFTEDGTGLLDGKPVTDNEGLDFLDQLESAGGGVLEPWASWIEAVTGHHGHLLTVHNVPDVSFSPLCDPRLPQTDRCARGEWLKALEQLFLKPAGLGLTDYPPSCFVPYLAGFCSVCDWIGSRCNEDTFTFCRQTRNLREYFVERCEVDARRMLDLVGIAGRSRKYSGVGPLLKPGHHPRSLQTLVGDLPLSKGLTLVEAPTGSGKTEAALAYAWRLISAGLADSIVFALPTQATANAMLGRLERSAPIIFFDASNLLLAHGSARFNKEFSALKHVALEGYEREDGWVQCSQWLAESRKRVFLGQIGVCTVDQVLISVLPVKHRFVRGFGVGRSVLVVDEVHAYDAYMYGLLEAVLRQQKESGGSTILLSATLPEQQQRQLCAAWGTDTEQLGKTRPYPLVTCTNGDGTVFFEVKPEQLPAKVEVRLESIRTPEMLPDDALLRRIVMAAEGGAQVAFICNLVGVAQGVTRMLRTMATVPVDLFHARYCYTHRREKEKHVIDLFGPDGARKFGRILVATQVVEQSLDVDFDWIVTQLCPVDLLFQRIGRLHRHGWRQRPAGVETPLCTVLLPDNNEYGLHELIYPNTRILWRTEEKLITASGQQVVFPAAYRTWIEDVYQDHSWENEPDEIVKRYEKFVRDIEEPKRYSALAMVHSAMQPFSDTDENITAVTRDGEMNLTVIPFFRDTQGRILMDGTHYDALDEYSRLESLSLNSVGVPSSWKYCFEEADEGKFWLELQKDGDGYIGKLKGVTFYYHKDMGLKREQ